MAHWLFFCTLNRGSIHVVQVFAERIVERTTNDDQKILFTPAEGKDR